MTTIEIINFVISILSLLATIAISFVIYFLEKRSTKRQSKHEIHEVARRFIVENNEEIQYLPWAVIASGCFPQNKYCRTIYNEFTLLDDVVKREVLKQLGIDLPLIKGIKWIDDKIELIIDAAKKLDLGDTLLHDGAKYFHRLYDQKGRKYSDFLNEYLKKKYDDVFELNETELNQKKELISFSSYTEYYMYFKYEKSDCFSKNWRKPFDYMILIEQIRDTRDEGLVCCWVSHIIEETICYSINYLKYKQTNYVSTDAQAETYEDRYFQIIYELYFLNK